jgi:AGCS family alanine or glycine:cation symporter
MIGVLNDFLWSKVLIVALISIGILFTFRSRFVQFRYFFHMFTMLQGSFESEAGQVSSFQALALSVAGRVGAGNIAGVAVAISLGGPGAIFWMWVIALIGMATSFFECTIGQVFKQTEPDGSFRGGPAYYMERALGQRWMGSVFSVLLLITFGFGFNAVQSYTVANSVNDTFGIPTNITGLMLMVILGLVIFGGVKRIAQIAEFIVPAMAGGYFLMALFVLITNITEIPGVISLIVGSAFGLVPAIAGGIGTALIYGVKRGLFSNEAGLGSAPNVASIAYVKHPVNQGIIQSFSVFIDTIILCTCTAAVILLSSVYQPGSEASGILLTQSAMAEHIGGFGRAFITIALVLFAFTSIIYNYYLGENSLNFFIEGNKTVFTVFRILTLVLIIWGAVQDLSTVFGFADLTMGLLAIVNIVALFKLANLGLRVMRDFDEQIQNGIKEPIFDARKFSDINLDRQAWETQSTPVESPTYLDM